MTAILRNWGQDCAGLADTYLIGMSEGPSFDAAVERRFQEYVEDPCAVVGNDARRRGLSDYMTGLLLPGDRKSMELIAERLGSENVSRRHQSIQHFVSEASWRKGPVRERVLGRVVPATACCTDGRDGVGGDLFRCSGSRLHAAQIQCRPPPPYSAAEATRDELGRV